MKAKRKVAGSVKRAALVTVEQLVTVVDMTKDENVKDMDRRYWARHGWRRKRCKGTRQRFRLTCTDYRPNLSGISYELAIMKGGRRHRLGHGFIDGAHVEEAIGFWKAAGAVVIVYKYHKGQPRASALDFVDAERREYHGRQSTDAQLHAKTPRGKGKGKQRKSA